MTASSHAHTVSNDPVVAMTTFSVWVSSFGGWLFGTSDSAYFLWAWALGFAVASVWLSHRAVNLGFVALGLALGPGLYAGLVVWFQLSGAEV